MNVYECIGMYMNVYECIWMHTNVYECIWMHTNVYECVWMYMNAYECIWTYMNVYECIRMDPNGSEDVIILMQSVVIGWKKKKKISHCTNMRAYTTVRTSGTSEVMCALYFHRCVHGGVDCCVFVRNSPHNLAAATDTHEESTSRICLRMIGLFCKRAL